MTTGIHFRVKRKVRYYKCTGIISIHYSKLRLGKVVVERQFKTPPCQVRLSNNVSHRAERVLKGSY